MSGAVATLGIGDVADRLNVSAGVARRLFSDQGGPLPRITYTRRVLTTEKAFERFLENPEAGAA